MDSAATSLSSIVQEWENLNKDFSELEKVQKAYAKSVEEFKSLEATCRKNVSKHSKEIVHYSQTLKCFRPSSNEEKEKLSELKKVITIREAELHNILSTLPKKNGWYLNIVLGNVGVNFIDGDEKYKYKEEYERFKLVVTIVTLIVSVLNISLCYKTLDALLHFLFLWYYCTLTIRESILVVNGSRIKGWWRAHHFITTVLAGVLILWPDGTTYHMFRNQFMWYSCYTSFLQFLQYKYQQGCLYRLRALGERYNMDITVDGFHSWMWRGLKFLLPFLTLGYCWQLYNAYTLFKVSSSYDVVEWQVPTAALIFFVLFLGNSLTTGLVVHQKLNLRDLLLRGLKER